MMQAQPVLATRFCEPERFRRLLEILDRYERRPHLLVPILQAVQHEYRYLPVEVLEFLATALGVSPATVYGVASFYAQFALEPKGKHVVRVCDGTACHVKGSAPLLQAVRESLGLSPGKATTDDLLVTVETVSCLGACGLAPVMVIDEEVHGSLTPSRAAELVRQIVEGERRGR